MINNKLKVNRSSIKMTNALINTCLSYRVLFVSNMKSIDRRTRSSVHLVYKRHYTLYDSTEQNSALKKPTSLWTTEGADNDLQQPHKYRPVEFSRVGVHSRSTGEVMSFRTLSDLIVAKKRLEYKTIKEKLRENGYIVVKKITPKIWLTDMEYKPVKKTGSIYLCFQQGTRTLKAVKVVPNNKASAVKREAVLSLEKVDEDSYKEKQGIERSKLSSLISFDDVNMKERKKLLSDLESLKNCFDHIKQHDVKEAVGNVYSELSHIITNSDSYRTTVEQTASDSKILKLLNRTLTENEALQKLYSFPFICSLKDYFSDGMFMYLVFPYYAGGTLNDLLMKNGGKLEESAAKFLAAELLLAIEFLQSNDLVHRDIKPENILICKDGHLALSDFGLSTRLKYGKKSFAGTPEYVAYEMLTEPKYSSRYLDFWAFGIVLYKMLAGYTPFSYNHFLMKQAKIANDVFFNILMSPLTFPEHFSAQAKDLLSGILTRDYAARIKGRDIKNHDFFADINFQSVLKKIQTPPLKPSIDPKDLSNNLHSLNYEDNVKRLPSYTKTFPEQEKTSFITNGSFTSNSMYVKRRQNNPHLENSF